MADLSQLSNDQLQQLYAITKNETHAASDNSTVTSSKGAQGSMQVMPKTQGDPGFGVRPSNGTPEDTAREGRDYYLALHYRYGDPTTAAMAYNWGPGNVDKWLANGGDLKDVPPETLAYAYNYNKTLGQQPTTHPQVAAKVDSPDLSKLTDDQLKQLYNSQQKPVGKGQDFLNQLNTDKTNTQKAVVGGGEALANMVTGGAAMIGGGLKSAYDYARGNNPAAITDVQKAEEKYAYQPKTPEGQAFAQKLGEGFNAVQGAMEQGAVTAMGAIPFVGEDLSKSNTAKEVAKTAADVVANVGPMLIGGEEARAVGKPKGVPVKAPEAAGELDKLNALYEQNPTPPTNAEPLQGQPNMGPQRPPITVDALGNATAPWNPPEPGNVAGQERAATIAQQSAGDLFPETLNGEGNASPFEPNRLSSNIQEPFSPDRNLRQGELDFNQANPPDVLQGAENGEVGTPEQMQSPYRDMMQQRTASMNWAPSEALDITSGVPHPDEGVPAERPAAPSEFTQAVETIAEREPDKYSVPADMDKAYQKYLDIAQGDLDPKTMAGKFTEAVRDQMRDDRVNNHPTVKANQARVDMFQQRLDEARGKAAPTRILQKRLDEAQARLERSKDNIGKALGVDKDQTLPYEKNGEVNMFTFGNLPEMMKSIGAILKALHGVVFRTLDKLPRSFSNLDSTGKIFAQGIRDKIHEQATREWPTEVNEQPKQVLNGIPGLREGLKDYLPFEAREDLSPADLKSRMQQAPDLAGNKLAAFMRDNFLTPQQLQAFSKHPLVKFAVDTVDRAMRDSAKFVRENLVGKNGIRNLVRGLSDDEFSSVWQMMQDNEGIREFTGDQLRRAGFTDAQIKVYTEMRRLDKMNLDALNRGRAQAGLKPVDARIAHIAGHFFGDFKRIITDKDGKVVAVIAHNLRGAVDTITKRVLDQLGEGHTAGPIEMRRASEGKQVDRYVGYMNILDDMAKRDDVISKVVDAYRDYMVNDGQTAMRYRAAFKSKEGVIGAEGRKSWQSQIANAKEGMKNFLKQQEALHTWANMQEALSKISDFAKDPEIKAPNAKAAVQKYLDNVQHRNQGFMSDFANGMVNSIAESTGVGPSILRNISNRTKAGLLTMFIGLGKLSHSFVTLIQPLQGIPVVSSLMRAEGANVGHPLGLRSIAATVKAFGSQIKIVNSLLKGERPEGFEGRAMDFARDNNTLNTTQFQFGDLTDINRSRFWANAHTIAEFNVTGMETATRSWTYMYYAHMLRDAGLPESEIFHTAHNAMKDVMVDYNAWERPGIFGKLGLLGDLTAMLTRYKFNQIDQFMRASRYVGKGQLGPMVAVMSTAMMAAGVRGVMAYSLANLAVGQVTKWAAENNLMKTPTNLDEMLLHFLHGKNETMSNMVKFGLPAGLGINMTGSLSHADDIPHDPLGALIPQSEPLGNYAKSAYEFLHDPNKATAKAALYGLAPNSARGVLENQLFTDKNGKYYNPQNDELHTVRTPAGQFLRNFGFRPLNEANESLTSQVNMDTAQLQASVREDTTQKMLRDIDSNGKQVTPEIQQRIQQQYAPKYRENNGDPSELATAIINHLGIGQARTSAERAQGIPNNALQSVLNYLRYQKLK